MTIPIAASMLALAASICATISSALAQQSSNATPRAAGEPVFETYGIRVTAKQASLSKDGTQLNIVALIENRNDFPVLAALLGKLPIATDNRGHAYAVDNLWHGVNGIATCTYGSGSYAEIVKACLDPASKNGLPIEAWTTLSKGAVVSLVFNMSGRFPANEPHGDNVSFSAVMGVRKLAAQDDRSSDATKVPPATMVTAGVPLIPVEKAP